MSQIRCDVVSVERTVFSDDVDMVLAPGIEGQLGILPHHAPLMTALAPGELIIRRAGQDDLSMVVGGGFMEVRPDRVTILADSAERAEEIDIARAEAARQRAQERLTERPPGVDLVRAEHALRRSQIRLKVARRRGRRPLGSGGGDQDAGESR
ncbi:MAG: F0F1 ATP synthase subunit epsilon [Chloroflexi bacterium]|nr:F0F1 ATP synthase subunit epsilon [Chloroflexota bacterium]